MEIGERIRSVRKEAGLTQKEFAIRVGITPAHVSNIESGRDFPSDPLAKLMCLEYGINEEWLKTGVGEMLDRNYGGEDGEISDQVLFDTVEVFARLLKTKSGVKYAHYSYCMNSFASIMENSGQSEEQYLRYLAALESLYSDLERFRSFMAATSKLKSQTDEEQRSIKNSYNKYVKVITDDLYDIFQAFCH